MATETIQNPDVDTQQRVAMNIKAKKHATRVLVLNQKYAAVLMKLGAGVSQSDYPALGTAIKAITGIQDVDLLIDGRMPTSIPAGTELRLVVDVQQRIEDLPAV